MAAVLVGVGWYLIVVSIYIRLMTRDAGIFSCVYLPFVSILCSVLFNSFARFVWLFVFLLLNPRSSLYILDITPLPVI